MRIIRSRVTLARIDAAEIDRQVASPFTIILVMPPPTKSHLPSIRHPVGPHAEALDGPAGGQALGLGHAELVALLLGGVADRPGVAPVGDAVEQRLALALGELLGVADLVDPPVLGQHHGADGERPGPRAPADLVDAHHDVVAGGPQRPLLGQARGLALERLRSCGAVRRPCAADDTANGRR